MDTQSRTFDGTGSRKLQALSRELNECLRRLAQDKRKDGSLLLLCECGRCSDTIEVTADVYEQARTTTPGALLVKQEHAPANPVRSQNGHACLVDAGTT